MRSVGLHGGECWVTWWRVLDYMAESVGLYGEVLGYLVESFGLHGGECWVTW